MNTGCFYIYVYVVFMFKVNFKRFHSVFVLNVNYLDRIITI